MAVGVVEAAPQPASKAAVKAAPSNMDSVALERRIIYYPDRLEGRDRPIGRDCTGPTEHGLRPADVSNGARTIFCVIRGHRL